MATPLAHLPVAGANNPVVVVKADNIRSDLSVEVIPARGADRVELPEPLSKYIIGFKKELESMVNLGFRVFCEGKTDYDALAYVNITNQIMRMLLSRLDKDDLEVAYSIDYRLGLLDHVSALRPVDLIASHYAWRRWELPVELGRKMAFRVRTIRKVSRLSQPFLDIDREALVHIVGKSAIALARAIASGDVNETEKVVEFVNGLWYSIYGLRIPCGGVRSTYVLGLEEVYCVEFELNPKISSF